MVWWREKGRDLLKIGTQTPCTYKLRWSVGCCPFVQPKLNLSSHPMAWLSIPPPKETKTSIAIRNHGQILSRLPYGGNTISFHISFKHGMILRMPHSVTLYFMWWGGQFISLRSRVMSCWAMGYTVSHGQASSGSNLSPVAVLHTKHIPRPRNLYQLPYPNTIWKLITIPL